MVRRVRGKGTWVSGSARRSLLRNLEGEDIPVIAALVSFSILVRWSVAMLVVCDQLTSEELSLLRMKSFDKNPQRQDQAQRIEFIVTDRRTVFVERTRDPSIRKGIGLGGASP